MTSYTPLHVHSSRGSIGDSTLDIAAYVNKTAKLGMKACALTEHGSMSTMYRFYTLAKDRGLQPIIGCEAYESDNADLKVPSVASYHLVLLATSAGVADLLTLVNTAALEGFYNRPRMHYSQLLKYGKYLIGLSGCCGGRIPRLLLNGEIHAAEEWVRRYQAAFKEFYLELQPGQFPEQMIVNRFLVMLSERTGAPLVATGDVHYLNASDAEAHDAHVKITRKKLWSDPMMYPDSCYYLMDRNEMTEKLVATGVPHEAAVRAIENTNEIAAACSGVKLDLSVKLPKYNDQEEATLISLCWNKLQQLTLDKPEKYASRLESELETIQQLGFCGYFLIVKEFIDWARNNSVYVGPGRGSVAGSLVAYLIGITQTDPIRYGLPFERFLSVHRPGIPDCFRSLCK